MWIALETRDEPPTYAHSVSRDCEYFVGVCKPRSASKAVFVPNEIKASSNYYFWRSLEIERGADGNCSNSALRPLI
ncbi:hypothetical protein BH11CYA1_BH11CYA1_47360 [soil metagenome]